MKTFLISLFLVFTVFLSSAQSTLPPPEVSRPDEVSLDDPRNKIYEKLERDPLYKNGGDAGWKKFIDSSIAVFINKQKKIKKGSYEVAVKFIIHKDGTVSDIQPITNYGKGLEAAAVEIIKKSGQWRPGQQNGWDVNSYKTQKLNFVFS